MAGYIHVFLSGVVLARVFVLLVCVDAATGDTPDAETEDFELSTGACREGCSAQRILTNTSGIGVQNPIPHEWYAAVGHPAFG